MNIDKYLKIYLHKSKLQKNLDEKTLKAYRIDLEQFNRFVGDDKNCINKEIIDNFIFELIEKEYAIKTIKRKVASIKAFLSFIY